MKILNDKAGKLNQGVVNTAIVAIVLVVVLFQVYASTMPTAQAAGDLMNASTRCALGTANNGATCFWNSTASAALGCQDNSTNDAVGQICTDPNYEIPLGQLFNGTGVVFIIIMASLMILVVKSFMKGKK